MNLRNTTLVRIKELEELEDQNIAYLREYILQRQRSLLNNPQELIQFLLLNDTHKQSLFDSNSDWANLPEGITVINQLLLNSNLIVDLKPSIKSTDQFIDIYGVSPSQMAELSRLNKVAINIIGYDSSLPLFQAYLMFESTDKMDEYAYCDLFNYSNGARIISKRRALFFELIGGDKTKIDNFDEEGRNLFESIRSLPINKQTALLNNNVFRSHSSIGELITSLSLQYGYNKKMLFANPSKPGLANVNETIINEFDFAEPDSIIRVAILLRAIKVLIASPLTASMGGIYNLSKSSLTALTSLEEVFSDDLSSQLANDLIPKNLGTTILNHNIKVELLNSIISELKQYNKNSNQRIGYLNDKEFKYFIGIIQDNTNRVKQLGQIINELSENPFFTEERLQNIQAYFRQQNEILNQINKVKYITERVIDNGITSTLTTGALLYYGIDGNSSIVNAIGLSTGISVIADFTYVKPFYELVFNHFLGTRHQVMVDIGKIKKLVR